MNICGIRSHQLVLPHIVAVTVTVGLECVFPVWSFCTMLKGQLLCCRHATPHQVCMLCQQGWFSSPATCICTSKAQELLWPVKTSFHGGSTTQQYGHDRRRATQVAQPHHTHSTFLFACQKGVTLHRTLPFLQPMIPWVRLGTAQKLVAASKPALDPVKLGMA